MAKVAAPKKPLTKTELMANIVAATDVPKKQVVAVLEALAAEIKKSLGNKGAGAITIPGLVKIEKKKVPARSPEGRSEPVQARRTDGPSRQTRLQQGQGAGAEAAQGHGEVAAQPKKDGYDLAALPTMSVLNVRASSMPPPPSSILRKVATSTTPFRPVITDFLENLVRETIY